MNTEIFEHTRYITVSLVVQVYKNFLRTKGRMNEEELIYYSVFSLI